MIKFKRKHNFPSKFFEQAAGKKGGSLGQTYSQGDQLCELLHQPHHIRLLVRADTAAQYNCRVGHQRVKQLAVLRNQGKREGVACGTNSILYAHNIDE